MRLRLWSVLGVCCFLGLAASGQDTPEQRAAFERRAFVVVPKATREALPGRVVNTTYLPVVTSQGALGTCGAYGITYYYRTFLKARQNGWVHPDPGINPERCASTAYTYKLLRHDPQAGASITGTVLNMVDFGVCSLADMAYDSGIDTYTWPEETYWQRAMPWRPAAAGQIPAIHTLTGQAVLKAHLYGGGNGDMATIALRNAPNLVEYPAGMHTDNEVLYALQEATASVQHALTVIGYDDNREYLDERDGLTKKGAFLVVNSWGTGWGVNLPEVGTGGFAWIAYDLFLQDLQDERNGSTLAAVMLERGDYTPSTMLRVELSGDNRMLVGGLYATGEGGEYVSLFPGFGEEAHVTEQGIWIDTTDLLASGSAGLRFNVWEYEGEPVYLEDVRLSGWDESQQIAWNDAGHREISRDFQARTEVYIGRYQNQIPAPALSAKEGDAAWCDWDEDGDLDVAITCPTGTWLWTNGVSRSGGLSTPGVSALPVGHTVRWLDANGDGLVDLLIAGDAETKIFAGDGNGGFSTTLATLPGCLSKAVAIADFDRDGRADVVLGTTTAALLYLNTASGFEAVETGLPAPATMSLSHGMVAAADLTGDGLPDILLAGTGTVLGDAAATRLYRNTGLPLGFEEVVADLPQVTAPAIALGDLDADGDLDVAISGCTSAKWLRLYINNGGVLTERDTALPILRNGALQWCDLNADGLPDLVGTGATSDDWAAAAPDTIAALNRGDGTFTDFGLPVPNVYRGFMTAQDANGDNNPDLLVAGTTTWFGESDTSKWVCGLYDYGVSQPGLFPVNTPPTAPANLASAHDGHGVFTFTWDAGSDNETAATGLRYELRCGTSAGLGDIVYNERVQSGTQLREPPVTTLHWQVRSVDAAGVVSPWSADQVLAVPAYQPQYRLELAASPACGGTLVANPAGPLYTAGTSITLTATPAPGFEFAGWDGDTSGLSRSENATFTIGEYRRIRALFSPIANPVHPVWTLVTDTIKSSYYNTRGHTLESFGGFLVRIAGLQGSWPVQDAVISADNGATWKTLWEASFSQGVYDFDQVPWSARYGHASAVYNGKLWVASGVANYTFATDVWYTTDLFHWTRATASAPWAGRENGSLVVANGKLWFLGGGPYQGYRCTDVWYTTDGANWTQATAAAPWVASYNPDTGVPGTVGGVRVRATALNDVLYATDGASVWSSSNGADWTLLAQEPDSWIPLPEGVSASPFAPLQEFGFSTFGGELVILGGENWRLGQVMDEVWNSANGKDWSRTAPVTRAHWSARRNPAACVHDGKLFLVGGESAASAPIGDVWSCSPGVMPVGMGSLVVEATPLSPWVSGTTEPPPGTYVDSLNTVFHLRAVPNDGYVLDRWEGPVVDDGDGDPATVQVSLAVETRVKAVFTYADTRLTVRVEPYGKGTTVPEAQTAYAYPPNQWVQVSAVAKAGYVFSHWTGPVEDANAPVTRVFMDVPHEVVAVFLPMPAPNRMSCATDWAAVVRPDGTVWAIGNNGEFQMGHELTVTDPDEFWPVALVSGVEQVYAERNGAKAVLADGTLVAWGSGYLHYLLGVRPHAAFSSLSSVVQCTSGGNTSGIFRKTDGSLCNYLNAPFAAAFGDGSLDDTIYVGGGGTGSYFAVRRDGTLFAWGNNMAGQLGLPDIASTDGPHEVPGIERVYSVATGRDELHPFTLALRDNGTVWSWGDPRGGQLGRETSDEAPAGLPAPVPGLSDVVKVVAGSTHALALTRSGQLYAWGTNHFGQFGSGDYDNSTTPVLVTTPGPVDDVAAGPFYSLLHLADDTYYWMGATPGDASTPLTAPTAIVGLGAGYPTGTLDVVVDPTDADGTVYPPAGQHPVVLGRSVHFHAQDGTRHVFSHWSNQETDADMFLALSSNATVTARYRFAYGEQAKLVIQVEGQGSVDPAPGEHAYAPGTVLTLTALPAAGHAFSHWEGSVAETDAGRTTILMDRDQTVKACFEAVPQTVPPCVATGLPGIGYDALVLHPDGAVYSCGASGGSVFVRTNTDNDPLTDCLRVAVGSSGLCLALALDSTVWSWGGEALIGGQNRLEGLTTFPGKVVDALGPIANAVAVGAGSNFGLALLADGTLRTWGYNGAGQLGHSLAESSVPLARTVLAGDGKRLNQIAAASCGGTFVVAARQNGTVLAWGSNTYGELGSTTAASGGVPQVVAGLRDIVDVEAGRDFAAALDASGQVWTWGHNDYGQCGHGTRATVETPARVEGLPPIAELALGETHALARDRNGGVWAWGNGENGRLGNNGTASSSTPVQVRSPDGSGYLTGIITIDCGTYSYAIGADGRLYSWGFLNVFSYALLPITYANIGASDPDASSLHALSLSCFPPEGGSLSPATGTLFLSHGTFVSLNAVPAAGYRFLYWQGNATTTTERVLGLRLVANTQLTAHFAPLEPRLRLAPAQTLAGQNVLLDLFLEGDTASVEGLSATVSLPSPLRFLSLVRGGRLPDTYLARGAILDDRTAVVLVSGPGDAPALTPNAQEPVYRLEVGVPADCPVGDYGIQVLPTPAVAIAAGRSWVEPAAPAGRVTVLPNQGIDLLFRMLAVPGTANEQEDTPVSDTDRVRQGVAYTAELWLRDKRREGSPVVDVRLDVGYETTATCEGVVPCGLIAAPSGTASAGSVTGYGGVVTGDRAPGFWYRLGALQFSATEIGTNTLTVNPATVVVTLEDESVLSSAAVELWLGEATVEHEANASPVAGTAPPAVGAWGTQIYGQLTGSDPNPGDVLVYTVVDGPAHGTLELDPATGAYVYTPLPYHTGADSFTFTVSDGTVVSTPVTQTLYVTTGWCVVLGRDAGWAMFGREPTGSDQTDDPGDLVAVADAPLAFVPAQGRRTTKLARDTRAPTGNVAWRLEVPAQETESALSWDPNTVPAGLRIMRIEPVDCPLGSERSVEMFWNDTIPLAADVAYVFDIAMPTDLALDLGMGWNLICLPGSPVFSDCTLGQSDASRERFVWRWDQQAYLSVTDAQPYTGYWYFSAHDGVQFFTVLPAFARDLPLEAGWNVIGVPRSMRVDDLFPDDTPVWRFRRMCYERAEWLDPGEGYWLYQTTGGTLDLTEERR